MNTRIVNDAKHLPSNQYRIQPIPYKNIELNKVHYTNY